MPSRMLQESRRPAPLAGPRWENGSEFHWPSYPNEPRTVTPWQGRSRQYGCARDALRSLIAFGQEHRRWQRLWIPSYFCQGVVKSLLGTGIPIRVYQDGPWGGNLEPLQEEARAGDAMLRVHYFGLGTPAIPDWLATSPVEVIEDHTHDPLSQDARDSGADWCIVSLRKTLPVPDGGVLWSPAGNTLPPQPEVAPEHEMLSLKRLSGMLLKGLYLEGQDVDKPVYRHLLEDGEEQFAQGPISGLPEWTASLVETFPLVSWRVARGANHRVLREELAGLDWVQVLPASEDTDVCPFSGILLFDTAERQAYVRRELIDSGVYPAVLWPLAEPVVPDIPDSDRAFSSRMLSIHCDMRYSSRDMEKVAGLIRRFGGAMVYK